MLAKLFLLLTFVLYSTAGIAQTTSIVINAPLLYDAEGNRFLENQQILIEGDKIKAVGPHVEAPTNARVIT